MGRTYYRNEDKERSVKPVVKSKILRRKGNDASPLDPESIRGDDLYEDLETEAYDEEFAEKLRRRDSSKF
tara:strand:- start:1961 stop:2170 length:210 start_codon:yes stop_codon:yes gene_type:complete